MLEATLAGRGSDLQVRQHDCVVSHGGATLSGGCRLIVFTLLRACTVFRDTSHESAGVVFVFLRCGACTLDSLNLVVQLFDKLQLVVGDLVLIFQLVVLKLKPAYSDFEQFVLAFGLHGTVLVEFVLGLLVFILFLPGLDLIPELLFSLLELLSFTAQFADGSLQLLDLDVFDLCVLLRCQVLHRQQQLLLLPLNLRVVRCHVLVLVLLQHLTEFAVKAFNLSMELVPSGEDLLPNLLGLG